jgi:hypothetical protein
MGTVEHGPNDPADQEWKVRHPGDNIEPVRGPHQAVDASESGATVESERHPSASVDDARRSPAFDREDIDTAKFGGFSLTKGMDAEERRGWDRNRVTFHEEKHTGGGGKGRKGIAEKHIAADTELGVRWSAAVEDTANPSTSGQESEVTAKDRPCEQFVNGTCAPLPAQQAMNPYRAQPRCKGSEWKSPGTIFLIPEQGRGVIRL